MSANETTPSAPTRALTVADAPAITAFLARTDRQFGNAPERGEPQVLELLAAAEGAGSPGLAVLAPDGGMRGVCVVWTEALLRLAPTVPADASALDHLVAHLRGAGPEVPLWVPTADMAVARRLAAAGWRRRYTDIQMRRDLRNLPPAFGIAGVEVTGGRRRRAAAAGVADAVRKLIDATWGGATTPEAFAGRFLRGGDADRDLWALGWDGPALVATALGRVEETPDGPMGHVAHLDVLPSHQGRGLGPMVLGELLGLFVRVGLVTAQLGVHRDNRSGAPDLYRRLGWRDISWQDRWDRPAGPPGEAQP
jgi:ribosomal protein S18 acetylase RimI-like enzyme